MSVINVSFTKGKRTRSTSGSSQESESPQHKKQQVITSPRDIGKFTYYCSPVEPVTMASLDALDVNAPPWAHQMFEKICSVEDTVNNLSTSFKMLEEQAREATEASKKACQQVSKLEIEVSQLSKENSLLKKRLTETEAYSKKYNLKFLNVPESQSENIDILLAKLSDVLGMLDLDLRRIPIDNIHRLPHSGKGPRPIIVKFVSFLDRSLVWGRKFWLGQRGSNVIVREHHARDVEQNIRVLLPIRRAAIQKKLRVRMIEDKLIINSQTYTVDNLHQLPDDLKPEVVSTRQEGNHIFFFSGRCPLSNWYGSEFSVGGLKYINGEQFIMRSKAMLFNDLECAHKIMKSTSPREMKDLGKRVKNFDQAKWHDEAKDLVQVGLLEKFKQNDNLKQFLLKTKDNILLEASPTDVFWGIGKHMYDEHLMDSKDSWGKNTLGQILMNIRSSLAAT